MTTETKHQKQTRSQAEQSQGSFTKRSFWKGEQAGAGAARSAGRAPEPPVLGTGHLSFAAITGQADLRLRSS